MTAQTRWQVSKLFKAALNKRREMPEESKGDIARWLFSEGMAVARAELEATIEQLRCELEGEKAAALNYRADAIKAEKQRDELLKGLDRMASKYNRPHKEYFGDEIAQDIASVKSDHFRDSAKMVEGGADTLADIDDSFVGRIDDAITEALGDAMDCTRVWSAWSYGTMGENDFVRVADDQGRVIEIRDAVLRVVSYTKEGGAA